MQSEIIHSSAAPVLAGINSGKFDLVVTSPPYNIGKSYEVRTSLEKYLEVQKISEQLNQRINLLSRENSKLIEENIELKERLRNMGFRDFD